MAPPRPEPLPVLFDSIPAELRYLNQWVMWRYEWKEDKQKWDKPPYNPQGWNAKSTAPHTWSPFNTAKEAYERGLNLPVDDLHHFDGIGFVPTASPQAENKLQFGDLDHCRDPDTGALSPEARADLDLINSYCEPSPSSTGVRFIAKGAPPYPEGKHGRKSGDFELYEGAHYLTITGHRLGAYPATIETRTGELEEFYNRHFGAGEDEPGKSETTTQNTNTAEPLSSDAAERLQELFAADPTFKSDLTTPAPICKRSDAEFHLCARLWEAGFDEAEIYHIMTSSPQSKWLERSDSYRWDTLKGAVAKAEASHRERVKAEEPNGPTVLTALQALLDNEDKIAGGCLWDWRVQKPRIERVLKDGYLNQKGEEKAHKFLKPFNKSLEGLGIDYDDLYPLQLKPKSNREEFSEEIKAKALDILKTGDPVKYVVDSCGRSVLGAEKAFAKLACCVSVQNVKQSAGLHPKFNGDSGSGKTFIAYAFAHHLPKEAVIKGSMSAKAGFYHKDGNRVLRLLDDYQAGNEDLDTVIKQTTSEFHEPYQHRTTIKQTPATLEIGSEQTWLITSVDASQDIQVLNRQIPINTDDSGETTKLVNDRTIKRYGLGEEQRPTDETVLICRAMCQILRDEGMVNVRIPFWERIKWLDTSNRRNPSIFMDLVIAHTAMRRYQRPKDEEGYYLAAEEDFTSAKSLFTDNDSEELVKRLTTRERDVIEKLVSAGESGLTRDELAGMLKVAPDRISQIISGQKGSGGLKQKVQIAETKKSETITINKDTDDEKRITVHKTIFSLAQYDKWAGFDGVVKLEDKPAPDEPAKPTKNPLSNPLSNPTGSSENRLSKISKKEEERRREEEKRDVGGSNPSSCVEGNFTKETKPVEPDSGLPYLGGAKSDLAGLGPHPRREDPYGLKKAMAEAGLS